jgi:lysyl-tRNA synthetase class I
MYSTNRSTERLPLIAAAGVTLAAVAGVIFHKTLVEEYGWEGALRYLWEGEPYSSSIQVLLDSLTDAEKARVIQDARLNAIEEALERARLDSIDDARTTKAIVLRWKENYRPRHLEITLGELSSILDKLAAQADAVLFSGTDSSNNSRIAQDIKRRKKVLSKQLVLDMERCDAFMTCYQVLQE